jgi:hypothetical protein
LFYNKISNAEFIYIFTSMNIYEYIVIVFSKDLNIKRIERTNERTNDGTPRMTKNETKIIIFYLFNHNNNRNNKIHNVKIRQKCFSN